MLRLRPIFRCISAGSYVICSASMSNEPIKVDKAALKELRTRTGFSYVNCRKALLEFGNDRLEEAEKWLRDMAQKEGWQKAAKLSSRPTTNGLVSVVAEGTRAALIEVSCETDFVARGDQFRSLVERLTLASLEASKTFDPLPGEKISVVVKDVDSLNLIDGTPARNALNEAINKLGENMIVPPLTLILAQPEISLWGYAHPPGSTGGKVQMGGFASVVGLEKVREDEFPISKLGRQICQHIIGMRAETMGTPPEPGDRLPVEEEKSKKEMAESESEDVEEDFAVTQIDQKETALLRQSFLLNPNQTVYDYVTGHGANIIDFFKVDLGEKTNVKKDEFIL